MPTYVYRCKNCGHRFEAWQHMTDDPLVTCPQCEGAINRVMFANGIVFKGSGFYSTDARHAQAADIPPATEKSDATEKPAATSEGATKTEATPSKSEPSTTKSETSSSSGTTSTSGGETKSSTPTSSGSNSTSSSTQS